MSVTLNFLFKSDIFLFVMFAANKMRSSKICNYGQMVFQSNTRISKTTKGFHDYFSTAKYYQNKRGKRYVYS